MEAHCVNMELKYQNQDLKDGQHGQILNDTSNKAKIKKEIKVLETINIDLEHTVAELLTENENKTVENADLKAQIQEKVFVNVALKNELRKLKGNSMDTNPHYFPKVREYVLAKPHHMIAPCSSKNNLKETYGSNDMAHKYYLEEAKKKAQERDRMSTTSVMPSTKSQNTTKSFKSKPRSNNQTSRVLPTSKSSCPTITAMPKADHSRNSSPFSDFKHFVCSTCQKCIFSANHDVCIIKILKEVNSSVKIQSPKTRDNTKSVEPTSHTQKPSRRIVTGHMFSPNKSSSVHEKTNTPRSCLRWIPTGRIFSTAGLRWVPTGKNFTSSTTKVDYEPLYGSNKDITNPYECNQTLNVSAVFEGEKSKQKYGQKLIESSNGQMASEHNSSGPALHEITPAIISSGLVPNPPPSKPFVPPSKTYWDILFQPLFDELLTPPPSVDHPAPEVITPINEVVAPEPAASTGSSSSTTFDEDAPSPSNSQTTPETQSPINPDDVEEDT
ncbi:hypothetical protein Tco_1225550 [Tanacetum coccineum]